MSVALARFSSQMIPYLLDETGTRYKMVFIFYICNYLFIYRKSTMEDEDIDFQENLSTFKMLCFHCEYLCLLARFSVCV